MLLLAWLSAEVVSGGTAQFDERTRALVHSFTSPALTIVMREFSFLGSPPVLWPLAGLTMWMLTRAGRPRDAAAFGICMLGALAIEVSLKHAFHRARPLPFFGLAPPESYSYPSGHAILSFSFCCMLAGLLARRPADRWRKIVVWTAAGTLTILIGFSRIYLGFHYPTDVVAGYGAGMVCAVLVISLYAMRRGHT
jgi:undecaprenyl-diphosphatase